MLPRPVNAPVRIAAVSSAGPYQKRPGVPVTATAASSWPRLCPMAPNTLTTHSSFSGNSPTSALITHQLSAPPAREKITAEKLPANSAPSRTRASRIAGGPGPPWR